MPWQQRQQQKNEKQEKKGRKRFSTLIRTQNKKSSTLPQKPIRIPLNLHGKKKHAHTHNLLTIDMVKLD